MFSIILQMLSAHSWFHVSKMILWRELHQQRLLVCCEFDWFHSNLKKQKPTSRAFLIVSQGVKVNLLRDLLYAGISVQSQILPWHYAVPRSAIFTTLHNSIWSHIRQMEAWNRLKWIVWNNNDMNVWNNKYFCPPWSYCWSKPHVTLPLVHNYWTIETRSTGPHVCWKMRIYFMCI